MTLCSSLTSTVKNTSGATKYFSVLPPHGRTLVADEELTVFGHIIEGIYQGDRSNSPRFGNAFIAALANGDLDIIQTPAPILYDDTLEASKKLTLDNGTLATADAAWVSSSSESESE